MDEIMNVIWEVRIYDCQSLYYVNGSVIQYAYTEYTDHQQFRNVDEKLIEYFILYLQRDSDNNLSSKQIYEARMIYYITKHVRALFLSSIIITLSNFAEYSI